MCASVFALMRASLCMHSKTRKMPQEKRASPEGVMNCVSPVVAILLIGSIVLLTELVHARGVSRTERITLESGYRLIIAKTRRHEGKSVVALYPWLASRARTLSMPAASEGVPTYFDHLAKGPLCTHWLSITSFMWCVLYPSCLRAV
jgi:hypothetical protein